MTSKTPALRLAWARVRPSCRSSSRDDAALVDADAATVTALAASAITDVAMVISQAKRHIHRKTHVSSTTEAEVEALKLAHKCDACSRTFPTLRGLKIHAASWCDGGVTQGSRRGSLADRAVQTAKRRAAGALRDWNGLVDLIYTSY